MTRLHFPPMRWALLALSALLLASPAGSQETPPKTGTPTTDSTDTSYDVRYEVRLSPTERVAHVVIRVERGAQNLLEMRLRTDPERHFGFKGDGKLSTNGVHVSWTPPPGGGALRYDFRLDHLRDERSYDARCTKTWAIFRGDDLVPPALTRTEDGARSRSELVFRLPAGWSIATPYRRNTDGSFRVRHPSRRFDRPTGWFVAGDLGVVREEVAGVRVAIAGPVRHGIRRFDMLAMLQWTLPELEKVLKRMPMRLLIVSAGDPMWRGGLSGPNSLYLHARRPLIGEDATSPLLHEVMHAMLGLRGGPGGDWIVEGLAELYSLKLLRRSGTLPDRRIEGALADLRERGEDVRELEVDSASGAVTARAVGVLADLDAEIRKRSEGERSLDDVLRQLVNDRDPISTASLEASVQSATGIDFSEFFRSQVGPSRAR